MHSQNKSDLTEKFVKLSVVIPVYNAEPYIAECVESVLSQSLTDIEVICVDDGSADRSLEILKEIEAKDFRVTVLEQENRHAGIARNYGLSVAKGEYVHFLDADDYVLPYAYEALYNKVKKYDLDMIRCASVNWNVDKEIFEDNPLNTLSELRPGDFNRLVSVEKDSFLLKISVTPWSGIYRRSMLIEKEIRFNNLVCCNDRSFYVACVSNAERIMIARDRLVFHRAGQSGSLVGIRANNFECHFQSINHVSSRLESDSIESNLQEQILFSEFRDLFIWFRKFCRIPELKESIIDKTTKFVEGYTGLFADALQQRFNDELMKVETEEAGSVKPYTFSEAKVYHEACEHPKVSVIVPTYNVEDYLNEALHSLSEQTLEDIEFVCINDGSTDGSLVILKEYAALDQRFKILDGPNGGYGKGMNRGLDAASGEYMGILEPDDFVPAEMFKQLYDVASKNKLDYVKSNFHRFVVNADGSLKVKQFRITNKKGYYNQIHRPLDKPETYKFVMNTWSGIYNIDFLRRNNIRHNETPGASYQDNGFWFQTFCCAERVMYVDKYYYMNRRDNPNSSMFSDGKMYAVTEEYRFIGNWLKQDVGRLAEVEQIYWTKKLSNFLVTLYRLKPELQSVYVQHLYKEFKEPYEQGIIEKDFFGDGDWLRFTEIMADPDNYLSKIRVSVIIPVYNAEKWLHQTLDGILIRNEIPFEVICVDDGSTDNSFAILKEYEEKDYRVRAFTQKNAGAGAARNVGMQYAHGEYLSFLDADDFFEPDMLRRAYDQVHVKDADIVVFRCNRFFESTGSYGEMDFTIKRDILPKEEPFAGRDIGRNSLRAFSGYAWDKLFRTQFVAENNLRFLEQPCINDQLFTFCAVLLAEKICTFDTVLVHYRRPEGALTFARDEGTKWRCYYDSLIAMREQMKQRGIYEEREQDFINYSLYFSIWNISTLHAPAYYELYDKLKFEWFDELGITAHGAEYFYNRNEWNLLQKMLELTSEEFLFWRTEDLKEQLGDVRAQRNKANQKLSAETARTSQFKRDLSRYTCARIDVKNEGTARNDLLIIDLRGHNVRTGIPDWFTDQTGIGHVIEFDSILESGQMSMKLQCIGDGTVALRLKGMHMIGSKGKRVPVWVDYTSFKVNGSEVLKDAVRVWHDKPYIYRQKVKDGEIIEFSCRFKSHAVGDLVTEKKKEAPRVINYPADESNLGLVIKPVRMNLAEDLKDKTIVAWGGYGHFNVHIGKIDKQIKIHHICDVPEDFKRTGYVVINKEEILKLKNPYVIISRYAARDIFPVAKWLKEHDIPFTLLTFLIGAGTYAGDLLQAVGGSFTDANGNHISISLKAKGDILIDAGDAVNAFVSIGAVDVKEKLHVKLSGHKPCFRIGDRNLMADVNAVVNDNGCIEIGNDCLFMGSVSLSHLDTCMLFDSKTGKRLQDCNPVEIGNHVCVGRDAEIFSGAVVGDNCIISAGSVLSEKFSSNVMIAGTPAKTIRKGVTWSRDAVTDGSVKNMKDSKDTVALSYMD